MGGKGIMAVCHFPFLLNLSFSHRDKIDRITVSCTEKCTQQAVHVNYCMVSIVCLLPPDTVVQKMLFFKA